MPMQQQLISWFLQEKRDFPWRGINDPYAVWVSEIMLQQTVASVVIPYFNRWMALFPDTASLAMAAKDDVIKAWEGLGYYSRARNLHLGAQHIQAHHGGVIPSTKEELLAIPGIGEYTAGAILNFAFKKKSPAIDGNVTRVIARFLGIRKEVSSVKKEIASYVESIIPEKNPQIVSESLIELGALICKKIPECTVCPLRTGCIAYQRGEERELPIVKPREKTVIVDRIVLVIENAGRILIKQESQTKVMQDLYEFPFFEEEGDRMLNARAFFEKSFGFEGNFVKALPLVKHSFTKYRVTLHSFLYSASTIKPVTGYKWVAFEDLRKLPFSSGHRRLLQSLLT